MRKMIVHADLFEIIACGIVVLFMAAALIIGIKQDRGKHDRNK